MQIKILTDNTKKAEFVQKALKYENLYVTVEHINSIKLPSIELLADDGFFVLISDLFILRNLLDQINKLPTKKAVLCLLDNYEPDLERLKNDGLIDLYYIRPFTFLRMASDMKYLVYNLKENTSERIYEYKDIKLDITKREVKVKEIPLYLRNKEFALLQHFLINQGKVLTRNSILEEVWDRNTNIFTNTVDVHVSQLRKKLKSISKDNFIYTVPCAGYIMR